MATAVTQTEYAGILKEVYGEKLEKLPFEDGYIQETVPFDGEGIERLGNQYHMPVMLTMEHGRTYNGTGGSVVTLNNAIAGASKDATVSGAEIIFRSQIAYSMVSRASSKGKAAFVNAINLVVENANDSARKSMELSILYGQKGLGVVESNTSGALVITAATWSAATWTDMENAILEAWTGTTSSETQHNGDLTISAVDIANRTVTVTGTSAAVVAGDVLYFKGARTASAFNEMLGLSSILGNTSATVFGISATSYSRWKGNLASSFGPVTMGKILEQIAGPVNRGFKGRLVLMMPAKAFEVLNSDLSALRRIGGNGGSYEPSKGENGFEAILYHHQRGVIEIVSHPLLRDGDMMAFNPKVLKRPGSADISWGIPSAGDESIMFHIPTQNAYEIRLWTDQAIFVERPAHCILFTGVTYS